MHLSDADRVGSNLTSGGDVGGELCGWGAEGMGRMA